MSLKNKKYIIGIDIGGTKILTSLMNKRFQTIATCKVKVEPRKGSQFFVSELMESIQAVLDEKRATSRNLIAIGAGCPGMIDHETSKIHLSPNIPFLKNINLKERLAKKFHVPVHIENDVNAGLYGEQQFGAAKGYDHVFGIFMGTGVGGAMILDGELYHGTLGGAGEIGHTHLAVPNILQGPSSTQTLESMTGRLAISSEAGYLMLKQKADTLYDQAGYDIKKIKSKSLKKSVAGGDKAILELIENKSRILGISMANIVNLLNPQLIVLGGGVVEALGPHIIPLAKKTMKEYAMPPLVKSVEVKPALLKDDSVFMGAAKLVCDYYIG